MGYEPPMGRTGLALRASGGGSSPAAPQLLPLPRWQPAASAAGLMAEWCDVPSVGTQGTPSQNFFASGAPLRTVCPGWGSGPFKRSPRLA